MLDPKITHSFREMQFDDIEAHPVRIPDGNSCVKRAGALIINADDWGRDTENTDAIVECAKHGTISSVSAMVFMDDSDRAASIARNMEIDAGLHLNFTTPFVARNCPCGLVEHQRRVRSYLTRHLFAPVVYNLCLAQSFEYLVFAQLDEFGRLYGAAPDRIDGHHHMHLCANVLFRDLLPEGVVVRRNFSFRRGEKSVCNRLYRRAVDQWLGRRHRITDLFFSLAPLEPLNRLERIFSQARQHFVEVETHPVNVPEYRFLLEGEIARRLGDLKIAVGFVLPG